MYIYSFGLTNVSGDDQTGLCRQRRYQNSMCTNFREMVESRRTRVHIALILPICFHLLGYISS